MQSTPATPFVKLTRDNIEVSHVPASTLEKMRLAG